jgi:hypothetical protein
LGLVKAPTRTPMIGVVQYTISQEEPDTINAIHLSTGNVSLGYTVIRIGKAKGDDATPQRDGLSPSAA